MKGRAGRTLIKEMRRRDAKLDTEREWRCYGENGKRGEGGRKAMMKEKRMKRRDVRRR